MYQPPERVYGIDFSADADHAGEKIWISRGEVEGDTLQVTECEPATSMFDVGPSREAVLPALASFLSELDADTAAGLDFPFGLPSAVVGYDSWRAFVQHFPDWFDSPEDMRRRCKMHATLGDDADGKRVTRATDEPLGALSPYGVRLKTQTFHGIRDVLRPLVLTDQVRVLPMQEYDLETSDLLEIYPAGTLDRLGLHRTEYKNDTERSRSRRRTNLDGLLDAGLDVPEPIQERALDDDDGDCLDSLVAACSTYQNTRDRDHLVPTDDRLRVEGHVYV